jgi:PAS domain S-box-containing protein
MSTSADRDTSRDSATTADETLRENADLRRRLEEAEETLRAIQSGAVDAVVISESDGHRVYTLEGADRPYRLMVEQMQQGAATLQTDGTIAFCNLRLAELLDTPHETLIGRSLRDFVVPDDRAAYDNLFASVKNGSAQGEAQLRATDQLTIPVYLTFNLLPADCNAAAGVLITDLTAQRHHEELAKAHDALREADERVRHREQELSDFFENASVGLHWVGPDGIIQRANRAELNLLGYTDDEYIGHHIAEFHADKNAIHDVLLRLHAREEIHGFETRMVCRDGSLKDVSITANVLWENGKFVHTRCFTRDITDSKRTEERLIEGDRRKTEFLATLAHELRGPLAPLSNMLHVMKSASGDSTLVNRARETMERQLAQMVRLVDDLLDVNRISQGKIQLKRERVLLSQIVDRALEVCAPLIDARKHNVHVSLPSEPCHVDADPVRLAQVFGNLLNNACKYTEGSGNIWLTALCNEEGVTIRVRDSGIGIPADKLDNIFEMFSQVEDSLKRAQGGLGIGLSLVRRLVEMHDGTVAAYSDGPGKGSEFVVRLPLAAPEAE